jgi:uncharacterized protein (DUF1499 family)
MLGLNQDGNVMSSERSFLTRSNVILVVGALISPWLLCQIWIRTSAGDEPFDAMPTCESDSMNCAHLGGGDDFRMEGLSLIIEAPFSTVKANLDGYIDDSNADVLVDEGDDTSLYIHFVERTSFWRFPDDVVVGLKAEEDGTTSIEMHSQSRLGKGDLGVNPDRLEGLHEALLA